MENTKIKLTTDLIKKSKTLTCDCGYQLFITGVVFKKISALISPSGEEELRPIEVIICQKCGKVPTEYNEIIHNILPEEILAKKSTIIK